MNKTNMCIAMAYIYKFQVTNWEKDNWQTNDQ